MFGLFYGMMKDWSFAYAVSEFKGQCFCQVDLIAYWAEGTDRYCECGVNGGGCVC